MRQRSKTSAQRTAPRTARLAPSMVLMLSAGQERVKWGLLDTEVFGPAREGGDSNPCLADNPTPKWIGSKPRLRLHTYSSLLDVPLGSHSISKSLKPSSGFNINQTMAPVCSNLLEVPHSILCQSQCRRAPSLRRLFPHVSAWFNPLSSFKPFPKCYLLSKPAPTTLCKIAKRKQVALPTCLPCTNFFCIHLSCAYRLFKSLVTLNGHYLLPR